MVTSVGLPLLIVNGKFQNLYTMSVKDLETFIPFLVKCSMNRAGAKLVNGIPEWWSSIIQFKFPLQKPKGLSKMKYLKCLCKIVCHCYWYHDAQYLLPFCASIAKKPESVLLKNNNDSTTSIFYAHKPIQIMRFNNLNKMYDIKPKKKIKDYRTLLPQPKQHTIITDVYLCENCDAEFTSHSDMLKHENECSEMIYDDQNNHDKEVVSDNLNDEIQILEHIRPIKNGVVQQSTFLNILGLENKVCRSLTLTNCFKKSSPAIHSKRWVSAEMCLHKNRNVEFSSHCGRKMLKHYNNYNINNKIEKSLAFNESHCRNNLLPTRDFKAIQGCKVTFKLGKRTEWVHTYSFSKRERISRYLTLKCGLNEESRKLLKLCRKKIPVVVLHRLKMLP